jgi:hypothetical protein
MTDYAAPSTTTGMDLKELLGSLLLIKVNEIVTGIQTSFGPSDAIRADVATLDGDSKGKTFDDTLIFPKVLQGQLRSNVGKRVLGRLGQGVAKPGQSAPWTLAAPTPEDIAIAQKYDAYITSQSTVAPATSAPAGDPF